MKASQNIELFVPVLDLERWEDLQPLPPNEVFEMSIDYPVKNKPTFKIKTGKSGLGLGGLLREIGKAYDKVYADPVKYGVWGHDIGDLVVEGIGVDYKNKTIKLFIGS